MTAQPVARKGDATSCGGLVFGPCATKWRCNGIRMARKTADVDSCGSCSPPDYGVITSGSPRWRTEGYWQSGVGDFDDCGAVIVMGSPNWNVVT